VSVDVRADTAETRLGTDQLICCPGALPGELTRHNSCAIIYLQCASHPIRWFAFLDNLFLPTPPRPAFAWDFSLR
jgi:hypothetical protein